METPCNNRQGRAYLQKKSFITCPETDHLRQQQVVLIKFGASQLQGAVLHSAASESWLWEGKWNVNQRPISKRNSLATHHQTNKSTPSCNTGQCLLLLRGPPADLSYPIFLQTLLGLRADFHQGCSWIYAGSFLLAYFFLSQSFSLMNRGSIN